MGEDHVMQSKAPEQMKKWTLRLLCQLYIHCWFLNMSVKAGWAESCRGGSCRGLSGRVREGAGVLSMVAAFLTLCFSRVLDWSTLLLWIKAPVRQRERDKTLLWILQWVVGLKVVGKTDSSQDIGEWDIHVECSPHFAAEHLTAVVRAPHYFFFDGAAWTLWSCQNLTETKAIPYLRCEQLVEPPALCCTCVCECYPDLTLMWHLVQRYK